MPLRIASSVSGMPVTSSASSASWPPPRRAATSITSGPPPADTEHGDGRPLVDPTAATARRATSTALSACGAGQSWATGTPKAGTSAQTRSVTATGTKTPSAEKPVTATSGPETSSSISVGPPRVRARAASIAAESRDSRRTTVQCVRPTRSVDLHDHRRRELDVADRVRDLPARLRDAGGREGLALPELARGHERGRGGQWMREAELLGDPRGDRQPRGSSPERSGRRAGERRRGARSRARRRSRRCSAGPPARRPGAAGSRSQTAVGMPSARAVSSTPSCSGPPPSTSRQRSSSPTGFILSAAWDGPRKNG